MSVKIMAQVWDIEDPRLTPSQVLILLAYADHCDHTGNNAYPSTELIARKTKLSARQIQRDRHQLEEFGYMVPLTSNTGGRQHTIKYRIAIPPEPPKGDTMTPFNGKGDTMTPFNGKGDTTSPQRVTSTQERVTSTQERVTSEHLKGDTMSPEPLINRLTEPSQETSVEPIGPFPPSATATLDPLLFPNGDHWPIILSQLRLQMTRDCYQTWLRDARGRPGKAENEYRIELPNHYALDWCEQRLAGTITRTARAVTGNPALVITFATITTSQQGATNGHL